MLIALLTMMLLGGTPTALLDDLGHVQDEVKVVMPKNDQRKAALDVLKQMEKRTKDQNKQVDGFRKGMQKLLSAHAFSTDPIDQMWGDYHDTRAAFQRDMIDLRFELKEHVSRAEWEQIFDGS